MFVSGEPSIYKGNATPVFIHVSFSDSPPQIRVSRQLWLAWKYLQPDQSPSYLQFNPDTGNMRRLNTVESFISEGMRRSDEETAMLPQNPDQDSVHTEWRDQVYHSWNHVFYDVAKWLPTNYRGQQDLDGIAHFHPPSSEAFGLDFLPEDVFNNSTDKRWDQDRLLIPAHLKKGVKIRLVATYTEEPVRDADTAEFMFDFSMTTDICYIRRGLKVKLYIEGDFDKASTGTAAVIVCGVMCSESHDPDDPPGRPEQKVLTEEETEVMERQAEAQSAIRGVLGIYQQRQAQQIDTADDGREH